MPKYTQFAALLTYLMLCVVLQAKSGEQDDPILRCGALYDLCGYVDKVSNKPVIPAKFEQAFEFSEGLAAVKFGGKFGFIDASGEFRIKPAFDLAGSFNHGLVEVLIGDKTGVINRTGVVVVQPQFARAIPINDDTVLVAKDFPSESNKFAFTRYHQFGSLSYFSTFSHLSYGLYDIRTGWRSNERFLAQPFNRSKTDVFWANSTGLWGLMQADGHWVIEPKYSEVGELENGLANVRVPINGIVSQPQSKVDENWGAIDETGKLVVPAVSPHSGIWRDGFKFVIVGKKPGLIDRSGDLVGGRYFDAIEFPDGGKRPRVRDGDKMFSVGPDGSLVADELENTVADKCPSGLEVRRRGARYAILFQGAGKADKRLFENVYINCNGPSAVQFDGKWGFVDKVGDFLPGGISFDVIHGFSSGYSPVKLNGKWGVIDENIIFTAKPIYESMWPNSAGAFYVKIDDKVFWIDAYGRKVNRPPPTGELRKFLYPGCRDRSVFFKVKGLFGLKAPDGTVMVEPKYRALNCYRQGIAWAAIETRKMWCPLDRNGELLKPRDCVAYKASIEMTHTGQGKMAEEPYESSVLWNRAYHDFGLGLSDKEPPLVNTTKF